MNTRIGMLACGLLVMVMVMVMEACSPAAPSASPGAAAEDGGYTFPVTFLEIGAGTVSEVAEFAGDVASKRSGELAFERAGRIVELLVDEGSRVAAGELLARLDGSVLEAELAAAHAAQTAVQAQRLYAELELARYEEMAEVAAESKRDEWRSEVAFRLATEAQRAADVQRLERLLAQGELHAPFSCVLVKRGLTLGSYATPGAMVFEVVDLEHREIRFELPQALATRLEPGLDVLILAETMEEEVLHTKLTAILPSALSTARTFTGLVQLDTVLDPQQHYLPGAFVRVRLQIRSATTETVVPADAMVESPLGWAVVVAEGAQPPLARFVAVRILAADAERVAVAPLEEGALQAGARVIVTGTDNIFPGAPLLLQPHHAPNN
jgi:RND family efflux transporter MFP subunit